MQYYVRDRYGKVRELIFYNIFFFLLNLNLTISHYRLWNPHSAVVHSSFGTRILEKRSVCRLDILQCPETASFEANFQPRKEETVAGGFNKDN